MITSARELAPRYFSGHTVPSSKSSRRIQVSRVLYDLSRGAENVMSRLLSHRDDTSSSLLPPSPLFFPLLGVFFFRSRSFLIVVSKLRRWSLVSGRNRPFYSTSIISPRHFTMVQRPRSDAPLRPSPSHPHMRRRVNFLQIGILLQFASSSIILAPPRSLLRLVLALASSFCSCHRYPSPARLPRTLLT